MPQLRSVKSVSDSVRHGGMKSLIKRAGELGIRASVFSEEFSILKFSGRGKTFFFKKNTVPLNRRMGNLTQNKHLTKLILAEEGISVPKGFVARKKNEALSLLKHNKLSFPLILKPVDGTLARGVTWNICSIEQLENAIAIFGRTKHQHKADRFLIEEMFIGDEFRILVFKGKVVSCVHKIPATVIGDGSSSIAELVHAFNRNRMKGFEIKIDKTVRKTMREHAFTLKSVLAQEQVLRLRHNLNMSDGGRSVECTRNMHPLYRTVAERSVAAAGLTYGGLDLMASDIRRPGHYVVLEINPNPFYNMHEKPLVEGRGIDFSKMIIDHLWGKKGA